MSRTRAVTTAVLLVAEAGLAAFGGAVAYGLTAEYGSLDDSRSEAFAGVLEIVVIALVLVGLTGSVAARVAGSQVVTGLAVAIPVLMLAGIWFSGPIALEQKLAQQYDAVPRCVDVDMVTGPGDHAARRAQSIFESIDHVGVFGAGGSSGIHGCDRTMTLPGDGPDVDVVGHYRRALARDGWTLVDVRPSGLRAEKGEMAFEIAGAGRNWTVWAGPASGSVGSLSGDVAP